METQTWWYGVVTYDKTFPFTTRLSLNKEEILHYCTGLWKDDFELRSIEVEKPKENG